MGSGVREFVKTWRRMGATSPRARFSSTIGAGRKHLGVPAIEHLDFVVQPACNLWN